MTRRDYIFLAECFADTLCAMLTDQERDGVKLAARNMAERLAKNNKAFNERLFLINAGVEER